MSKVTINLPDQDAAFAEEYASGKGVSLSELIARIIRQLRDGEPSSLHPEVQKISGILPSDLDAGDARLKSVVEKHQ